MSEPHPLACPGTGGRPCGFVRPKRTKPAVIMGLVELMCLLCGARYLVNASDWRIFTMERGE